MNCYANSPYWTDDVNERFKILESGNKELANALKLLTATESKVCEKQLNNQESLKFSKAYQMEIHQLSILLQNAKDNQQEILNILKPVRCVL
ncbi:Uncharacterised protein [Providencia rustigianii]|nr:Uncharacterised protein [Providencia rustigianii]